MIAKAPQKSTRRASRRPGDHKIASLKKEGSNDSTRTWRPRRRGEDQRVCAREFTNVRPPARVEILDAMAGYKEAAQTSSGRGRQDPAPPARNGGGNKPLDRSAQRRTTIKQWRTPREPLLLRLSKQSRSTCSAWRSTANVINNNGSGSTSASTPAVPPTGAVRGDHLGRKGSDDTWASERDPGGDQHRPYGPGREGDP